jgi:hypothetical protein
MGDDMGGADPQSRTVSPHHFVSWVGRVSLITRLGWRRRVGRRARVMVADRQARQAAERVVLVSQHGGWVGMPVGGAEC